MLHGLIQNSAALLREAALNSAVRSKVEVKKIKLQNILMDTKLRGQNLWTNNKNEGEIKNKICV